MVILSSPSGTGKTTLVKLLSESRDFYTSISHTTRKPRNNEEEGKDYYFVNNDQFQNLIKKKEFLEYANVFSHLYGTTKTPVIKNLENSKNVVFDIDWQGTEQIKKKNLEYKLPYLSMGMSEDYEKAITFGATHIRVGTAIFGERLEK